MSGPEEIAKFVFGITGTHYPDGSVFYVSKNANHKVPDEIVIMQLKAYLKKLEKQYLNS